MGIKSDTKSSKNRPQHADAEKFCHICDELYDKETFLECMGARDIKLDKLIKEAVHSCKGCAQFARPRNKPPSKIKLAVQFNYRVPSDHSLLLEPRLRVGDR